MINKLQIVYCLSMQGVWRVLLCPF